MRKHHLPIVIIKDAMVPDASESHLTDGLFQVTTPIVAERQSSMSCAAREGSFAGELKFD